MSIIKEFFELDWRIDWQGINVADSASGAGGDITISRADRVLMAVEITERTIDRSRVVVIFNTKIAPLGIEDYLFFIKDPVDIADAKEQARRYFSLGHEINFLNIKEWIINSLATMGQKGRELFNRAIIELLDDPDMPRMLKVGWNDEINRILSASQVSGDDS